MLRFSALFAELADGIMPFAINDGNGLFRATARSSNGLDLIFEFMNPVIVFEVTFLNQLPTEEACSSGKNPYDVANHVQRIIADTLRFECTSLTKKDKYKYLT